MSDELNSANRRAEYWKAEHNAANDEITRLRADLAASQAECERLSSELETARDGWHQANGVADLAMEHRDEAEKECERLRHDIERQLSELLPGPFYMDPPDGGDVPVMEQLRRMADDAERFRWLTEDHADRDTRARCRAILECMPVRSYSAACLSIDAARAGKGE